MESSAISHFLSPDTVEMGGNRSDHRDGRGERDSSRKEKRRERERSRDRDEHRERSNKDSRDKRSGDLFRGVERDRRSQKDSDKDRDHRRARESSPRNLGDHRRSNSDRKPRDEPAHTEKRREARVIEGKSVPQDTETEEDAKKRLKDTFLNLLDDDTETDQEKEEPKHSDTTRLGTASEVSKSQDTNSSRKHVGKDDSRAKDGDDTRRYVKGSGEKDDRERDSQRTKDRRRDEKSLRGEDQRRTGNGGSAGGRLKEREGDRGRKDERDAKEEKGRRSENKKSKREDRKSRSRSPEDRKSSRPSHRTVRSPERSGSKRERSRSAEKPKQPINEAEPGEAGKAASKAEKKKSGRWDTPLDPSKTLPPATTTASATTLAARPQINLDFLSSLKAAGAAGAVPGLDLSGGTSSMNAAMLSGLGNLSTLMSANLGTSLGGLTALNPLSQLLPTVPSESPIPAMPGAAAVQQIGAQVNAQLTTRVARRLYVANIPPGTQEEDLKTFLNGVLLAKKICSVPGTDPVVTCNIQADKSNAFIELSTTDEAEATLDFDGISYKDQILKIRRPKDYSSLSASAKEKNVTNELPELVASSVVDSPYKVFLGNLHKSLTTKQVRELVTSFGVLKAFSLRKDRKSGVSKGYAFLEYVNSDATKSAVAGLSGIPLYGNRLVAVLATPEATVPVEGRKRSEQSVTYDIPKDAKPLLELPESVLELQNVLSFQDLKDPKILGQIKEDIRLECAEHGTVKSMHVTELPSWSASILPGDKDEKADIKDAEATTGDSDTNVPLSEQSEPSTVVADETKEEGNVVEDAEAADWIERICTAAGEDVGRAQDVLGLGKVYVQFARSETACNAAHALHLRSYGDRIVRVAYFPLSQYVSNFQKKMLQ